MERDWHEIHSFQNERTNTNTGLRQTARKQWKLFWKSLDSRFFVVVF